MEGIQNIGQRIVQAARLAVAVHLYESETQQHDAHVEEALRVARRSGRQRVMIGGADPIGAGDQDNEQQRHPPLPSLGDLVTDDEWDGLMGRDPQQRDNDP
jgi:hypothetical protein